MNVVETLQAEHAELSAKLHEMDEHIRTERPGLVAQIAQLHRAIVTLTKPAPTPGTRKPMSPEAKERIRAGLERARAAKLEANKTEPVASLSARTSAPVASEQSNNAKKPVANDKGANRGL